MAGTPEGGLKAAASNRQRYGSDFYRTIGRAGGKISRGGGFASNPELAREAGRRGGITSRRNGNRRNGKPWSEYVYPTKD